MIQLITVHLSALSKIIYFPYNSDGNKRVPSCIFSTALRIGSNKSIKYMIEKVTESTYKSVQFLMEHYSCLFGNDYDATNYD